MGQTDGVKIGTEQLRAGSTGRHPIHDPKGTLLLEAGEVITPEFKEQLSQRGIDEIVLHPDDARGAGDRNLVASNSAHDEDVNSIKSRADALADTISLAIENAGKSLRESFKSPGCAPYDDQQHARLVRQFDQATVLLETMVASALQGTAENADELRSTATGYISELTKDSGHVVFSSQELAQDELINRSVRMSILGMATAIEMGFDEENVRTVGVCGLVHDWGMFRLEERLRDPRQPLAADDWSRLKHHPIHTLDLLERVEGISAVARTVCYQVHECFDGSGYPNGREGNEIHLFARILNLVDAYLSLTSCIRGRSAFIPYDAMVYLLHQGQRGRFDRDVVRALVLVQSMYPVGSHVQLSDGSEARVVRTNGANFTAPIVQKLSNGSSARHGPAQEIIDLTHTDTKVVQPLFTPDRKEMRVPRDLMDDLVWDGPGS